VGAALGWLGHAMRPVEAPAPVEDPAIVQAGHDRVVAEIRAEEARARARVEVDLAAANASIVGLREQLASTQHQFGEIVAQHRRDAKEREVANQAESKVLRKLAPVESQLTTLQQKIIDLEKQRSQQHGALAEQIRATRDSAEQSRSAAQTLSAALRNNAVRGAYGETQLKTLVESAGLLNRIDFNTQESITADSGARRPDMVIKLPGRKQVAIDAKVPYNAFIDSHSEELSDTERATLRTQHAKAVKAHVDALSGKQYWTGLESSPEFTIAFIPSEAILNAAVEADPSLLEHAFGKGIVLATPANLWALLKTVALTWKQEDLADNAQELVDLGRDLYKRLGTLAEHVSKLGRSIERTVTDYNKFTGSLETRVLATARKLDAVDEAKQLGHVAPVDITPRPLTTAEMTAVEDAAFQDLQRPELDAAIIDTDMLFTKDDQAG
ncbi:MAG: DNA recombination protein RmuC, partial [Aeromicrobium sp.]